MIVTRKRLDRRTLLQGLGVVMGLPLLDAMTPAFATAADLPKYPVRMAFGYVPNGIVMENWTPKGEGADFEIPRTMRPFASLREDMTIFTGLSHRTGAGGNGDHARAGGEYLTGVRPKRTTGADISLGISVDQVAAQAIGHETRLPSLELACEATRLVGSCDAGYSCAYQAGLAWTSETTPLPPEVNPRSAFERLFGSLSASLDPKEREALTDDRKSVLDFVSARTSSLMGTLGSTDRQKMDEYMTSIREIEKRIIRSEGNEQQKTPELEKPAGVPSDFAEHARLMHDLMIVAFQADITRISTLLYAREGSNRMYPELGFTDGHHPITHHRYIPELVEKVTQINSYHVEQFAYLVKRMKEIKEGDGTLLDHSMVVYGSSLSDGNAHDHTNLPVVMFGKGDGTIKTGRHIVYPETPMTNLFLSMLDHMNVPYEELGDSTGKVALT